MWLLFAINSFIAKRSGQTLALKKLRSRLRLREDWIAFACSSPLLLGPSSTSPPPRPSSLTQSRLPLPFAKAEVRFMFRPKQQKINRLLEFDCGRYFLYAPLPLSLFWHIYPLYIYINIFVFGADLYTEPHSIDGKRFPMAVERQMQWPIARMLYIHSLSLSLFHKLAHTYNWNGLFCGPLHCSFLAGFVAMHWAEIEWAKQRAISHI